MDWVTVTPASFMWMTEITSIIKLNDYTERRVVIERDSNCCLVYVYTNSDINFETLWVGKFRISLEMGHEIKKSVILTERQQSKQS